MRDRASVERQPQFRANPRQDGIQVVADFLVREAQDVDAPALENFRSPSVVVRKPFVLLAIAPDRGPGVHYQLGGVAVEVGHIAV